ncbi:MAG: 23S rRNA (adenine(2030)-N(6))-methyltransferase RlmJ, partial [Gammaproteobacteria bacterium]|nr:23S rRNA (adenine(2030)-N(6))-methyltransferase RlmJ [Gammaproteobacteria bacterium]
MNYRHAYHAGSFTDVIKHTILIMLMEALARKESPFCYIDTHAGAGYYNLSAESAAKNKEYLGGIEKIIQQDNPPPIIKRYLDCIHHINNQLTHTQFSSLKFYPGSPMIARHFLRAHDKIIACELQAQEYQLLKNTFAGDKQVAIHHMDGFLGLKAFLPPQERRGLVLIDPPYENPDELMHI